MIAIVRKTSLESGWGKSGLNPNMALQEIAKMSGFRDFNYFLKVFKKIQGHTPTEYRTSVLRP